MTLGQLRELHLGGALNIKYEKGQSVASIGDMQVTLEQATQLASQLGWIEYVLSPFEIIDKTNKFIRGLKNNLTREDMWKAQVQFQNRHSNEYGKTFDRIVVQTRKLGFVIIYNMEHAGGKYVVYELGKQIPAAKCRNLKAVSEFINNFD